MRLFNRADLGRLYLSSRHGPPSFRMVGDGALDGLSSATTVSMAGTGDTVSKKTWTGSVSARPGYMLAAAAQSTDPVDLLVLYGDQCDIVQQTDYIDAVLVEGVVFSADTYSALTSLTSDVRGIVGSTHTLTARSMLRISAPDVLSRIKTFDGRVVAICLDDHTRIYALVAKSTGGGAMTLTLAWSDSIAYGAWYTATISGSYTEPAYQPPPATWMQLGIAAFGGSIYIANGTDLLRVPVPTAGMTTLYPAAVRPVGYAASGSPDQACRIVGMKRSGDSLYAGTLLGQLWRITPSGIITAASVGGGGTRSFNVVDDCFVLTDDANVRTVDAGGRQRRDSGWSGNARFASGAIDNLVVINATGEIWTQMAGGWSEGWNFSGAPVAVCQASRNLLYALVVAGAKTQTLVSVAGGTTWTEVGRQSTVTRCVYCRTASVWWAAMAIWRRLLPPNS